MGRADTDLYQPVMKGLQLRQAFFPTQLLPCFDTQCFAFRFDGVESADTL